MTVNFSSKAEQGVLEGQLTRDTVPLIKMQSIDAFLSSFQQQKVTIDLSQIAKIDTAGLAWLFVIMERAKENSCQLSYIHLSKKLERLAKLSSVDSLLVKS